MLFINGCGHPDKDYLFSVGGKDIGFDVFFVTNRWGINEFCFRFGDEEFEYLSSMDCHSVNARINWKDTEKEREQSKLFIEAKQLLMAKNMWDIS